MTGNKTRRLGKVYIFPEYVVDLNDPEMVKDAKSALFEDIMNAVKFNELHQWIDVKEDPTAKLKDIPSWLLQDDSDDSDDSDDNEEEKK